MHPSSFPRGAVLAAALAACGGGEPPAVPSVDGPLALAVRHPGPAAVLAPGGFAYLAGSAGSGRARMTVDGVPVPLHPNGSFAAYLPVPGRPFYELVAVRGGDTVRVRHPVALAAGDALSSVDGPLRIDPSAVRPRGEIAAPPEERIAVSLRAPAGASAWVQWPGGRQPLDPPLPSPYASPGGGADRWSGRIPAARLAGGATLVVARGGDTARLPLPRAAAIAPGARVELRAGPEGVTPASDTPDGRFAWLLLPGTRLPVTGRAEGHTRVGLDGRHQAWVRDALAAPLEPAPAGERVIRGARLVARRDRVELEVAIAERPPFRVEEGAEEVSLVLYGARMAAPPPAAGADPLVRRVEARPEPGAGTRLVVHLSGAPYGYEAAWRGGRFVLALRRPPAVSRRRPLRGLTIAVDAGHPPHGAVGPTGLREADVTLAVARVLARDLEQRGARVVMTRERDGPVALEERVAIARRAGAHALVSLHADAVPPSVNAAEVAGTATYYYHRHSAPLAEQVQRGMVRRMGLADLGTGPRSVVVARPTWFPAALAEGATLVWPPHEAALRAPRFQRAYARGVADGVEAYFRALGGG